MYNDKTRLIDLTVQELKEIVRDVITQEMLHEKSDNQNEKLNTSDIIYLKEVSELTNLKRGTIYNKVSKMEMPSVSRSQPLSFSRKEIEEWMQSGRPTCAEAKAQSELLRLERREL
jgi:predicted DNA-binding transcriptional regulator AlpA